MKKEEFIEELKQNNYLYEIEGDKIIVTHDGYVYLNSLETLPPGVEFRNGGSVWLNSLKTIPSGVEFRNGGHVSLRSLKTIHSGVKFRNGGNVNLDSLKTLPSGVEFKNGGDVKLSGLGWVRDIKGIMIEGVENKRLLHLMISKGLFV